MLGTVVAGSLMDKAGRKQLLTLSFVLMGISMLSMSAGLALPAFAAIAGPIALVGTLTYILGFALGAGPVPGLLVPEITPAPLRGMPSLLPAPSHCREPHQPRFFCPVRPTLKRWLRCSSFSRFPRKVLLE